MVKHTQTIRLSMFDHFVGLAVKGLRCLSYIIIIFHVFFDFSLSNTLPLCFENLELQ